jgi:hypothetical protein
VELFSSLLPSPVVLRGVAKQSSLHSSSWPSDTSVTDPTTRKRHRLADCIPASVSQIDADAESLDDSGSDGFDVDTAFLSHNLIKKGTPRHSSQFRCVETLWCASFGTASRFILSAMSLLLLLCPLLSGRRRALLEHSTSYHA